MTESRSRAEASLVRRCANGDADAWETFVDAFGPLLAALARRMLKRYGRTVRETDVDEVVAEVFLALLRRDRILLRRFDPTYRLSTYLGVICRTEVTRLLRRGRRTGLELEQPARVPDRPERFAPEARLEAEERREALERLAEALRELPPRDRLLLTLRFLDGRDYRAIAGALGLSPQSVGPLLHRAKARLAKRVPALARMIRE